MERIGYKKSLENALMQCQEIMERFEGSAETLRHIQHVKEALKRLATEAG